MCLVFLICVVFVDLFDFVLLASFRMVGGVWGGVLFAGYAGSYFNGMYRMDAAWILVCSSILLYARTRMCVGRFGVVVSQSPLLHPSIHPSFPPLSPFPPSLPSFLFFSALSAAALSSKILALHKTRLKCVGCLRWVVSNICGHVARLSP